MAYPLHPASSSGWGFDIMTWGARQLPCQAQRVNLETVVLTTRTMIASALFAPFCATKIVKCSGFLLTAELA